MSGYVICALAGGAVGMSLGIILMSCFISIRRL